MYSKHKVYYSVEVEDDDTFIFVCAYSTYDEAKERVDELSSSTDCKYRILRIEKDIEEII